MQPLVAVLEQAAVKLQRLHLILNLYFSLQRAGKYSDRHTESQGKIY